MRTITITEPTASIQELTRAVAQQSPDDLIRDLSRDLIDIGVGEHEAWVTVAGCACNLPPTMRIVVAVADPDLNTCLCSPTHVKVVTPDGGCMVCAECDNDAGHTGAHDCDH